ncbi:hypothetical protein NNO95_04890 [Acinetobacter baumannii]|uniref:hypothetical protein n=1 Tax=Acinetobacter baumannii TaxID=470 RepID=UPI0020CF6105|nr:hypothetical protein [Acinetobacter baumannii]MCQ1053706.1 hypothetical protein [Acinetobacter baumannii]
MSNISALSKIAAANKLEHKLHYAWQYCKEVEVQYSPMDSLSKEPWNAAEMIWAHGRYGKRSEALKKIDAIHLVCTYLNRGTA